MGYVEKFLEEWKYLEKMKKGSIDKDIDVLFDALRYYEPSTEEAKKFKEWYEENYIYN